MPLNSRIAFVGLSKQTVLGTAVTPPTFGLGLRSGNMLATELAQDIDELTSTNPYPAIALRLGVTNRMDFVTRSWPRSIGLLVYGILGSVADSGVNPNYTHTITPGSTTPYLTGFARLDTEYAQVKDCKVEELTITWEGTAPPEVAVKMVGTSLLYGSTWTATNDDSTQTFMPTAGGTFKVDTGSGTAVVAPVVGGSISFTRPATPIVQSKQIEPTDVFPTILNVDYTLKLLPDNLNEWRKIVTNSSSGTTVYTSPVYGAADVLFSIDANTSLQVASTKVAFVADFPGADPSGQPSELTVVGRTVTPAAGNFVTATLKNAVASY